MTGIAFSGEVAEYSQLSLSSPIVHYRSSLVQDEVFSQSRVFGVDSRTLAGRVALHLPRFADAAGNVSKDQVQSESKRLAKQLHYDMTTAFLEIPEPREENIIASTLTFRTLDADTARTVFDRMHFLRSWRANANYYALTDPTGTPVACCGVAELKSPRLARKIATTFSASTLDVYDLCRVYAMPWAPRNSISMLLSNVCKLLTRSGDADIICTAVDPNIGFLGSSYRSSNWIRGYSAPHRSYRYVDGDHQTMGQLQRRYHMLGSQSLSRHLQDRYEESVCRLKPRDIYIYPLNKNLRAEMSRLNSSIKRSIEILDAA